MKNFQIIILIVFVVAAVLGVLVFSGAIPLGSDKTNVGAQGTVTLWGTVKATIISPLLDDFNRVNQSFSMKYVEKAPDTFDADLLEALASGEGPDMFLISDDLAYKYSNKIFTIPYQNFPLDAFKNSFIGAGEVFLSSRGVMAFPLSVDPLMLYYNQSMLDAVSIGKPPSYWDEFSSLIPLLTKKDSRGALTKSTIALGQFGNITHAKAVLAALFMQAGNPIVTEKNGSFISALAASDSRYNLPSILKFYTDFADPLNEAYTWNKSFSSSSDAFSAENLAFYLGYASELEPLVNKNPNQNFLVAAMPQIRGSTFKLTAGHVMGVAVAASSKNLTTALSAAGLMASSDFAGKFASSLGIAPARRDLLAIKQTDAYLPFFYASAFFARSWLDPSPRDTDVIFEGMVEKVLSNSMTVEQAVSDGSAKLGLLLAR